MKRILFVGVLSMLSSCAEKELVSIVDPRVLSVPIEESYEPFIDLKEQSVILLGPSPEIPNNQDYTKMRHAVYHKLVEAQKILPHGLKLCLYEGYRSLQLQEKLFNDRYQILKNTNPHWDHQQLFQEAIVLVSPVINIDGTRNIPPHSTGGAVDVYLVDSNNEIVDMGIKAADWMQDIDGSISKTDSPKISDIARQHRSIMSLALEKVGFVNYPGEYWHWSYGDRYWAYHVGHPQALYGSAK
jgi:D-alanyl-D-alanine dipeptidase